MLILTPCNDGAYTKVKVPNAALFRVVRQARFNTGTDSNMQILQESSWCNKRKVEADGKTNINI